MPLDDSNYVVPLTYVVVGCTTRERWSLIYSHYITIHHYRGKSRSPEVSLAYKEHSHVNLMIVGENKGQI